MQTAAGSHCIALTTDWSPPQGPLITGDILVTHLFRTGEFKDRQKCVFEVLKIHDAETGRKKAPPREAEPAASFISISFRSFCVQRKNNQQNVDVCEA